MTSYLMLTKCRNYALLMRLHRSIGSLLLLWPTLWALWIAGMGAPSMGLVIIFVSGVFLMRSAGCVVNDLVDRDFDGFVRRTQNRPLVAGLVSRNEALMLFCLLCLLAAGLLVFLNAQARWLAIPALLLAIIYPFMKRYTHLPQLVLGLAFSWGIPMVFAAQKGYVPALAWLLVAINVLWAIAYDTIYAMVDREDDLKIGIKSTAILFGRWDIAAVAALHGLMLVLLVILGHSLHADFWYYLGLVAAGLVMIYLQYLIRNRNPAACFRAFVNSQWVGCMLFIALLLNYIMKH